ncbi:hypothetical protein STHU_06410 [Allostella humosa]|nr:hypothetical protein STHU_06410 [Stella humosa]
MAQAVTDGGLRRLRCNPAWTALFGGQSAEPAHWPDEAVTRLAAAPPDGSTVDVRLAPGATGPDGPALVVTARAVRRGRGHVLLLSARRDEAAIDAAAERAAALGQLLASIVHELNNQLSTILAQTQLLRRLIRNQSHGGRLDRVVEAARQSARIVTNLLDLARRRPIRRTPVAMADVTGRAVELVRGRLERAGVELATDLPADLPLVAGDTTGLGQIVVNLVTNACDALAEVPQPRRLSVALGFDADARMLELRVADNGPGIPPAIMKRIFQPFFTTKPEGMGTGLGLSLCVTQVKELGGSITVSNRPEGGAEFLVRLPVSAGDQAAAAAAAMPRPAGGAAILVIDDDQALARYIQSLLRREGHAADLAGDGVDALRRIDRRRYDLLISDIHMAGMDGATLFQRLERDDPESAARILFMTGDIANPELEQFFLLAGRPVIAKPFDDERFLSVVAQLLGRTGSRSPPGSAE